jgi:hypothetical protein
LFEFLCVLCDLGGWQLQRLGGIMAVKKAIEPALDANALARAAGLGKAVKQFPDDVAVAAQSAASTRSAAGALDLAAAEPWPPMRVRSAS